MLIIRKFFLSSHTSADAKVTCNFKNHDLTFHTLFFELELMCWVKKNCMYHLNALLLFAIKYFFLHKVMIGNLCFFWFNIFSRVAHSRCCHYLKKSSSSLSLYRKMSRYWYHQEIPLYIHMCVCVIFFVYVFFYCEEVEFFIYILISINNF